MVNGLSSGGANDYRISVSPRNADRAQELARRFPSVTMASSNQEVLDGSEVVVLAVKPAVAREVISQLRFRPEHHVVSVVAGFPLRIVCALAAPATRVTRAVPLPSVAERIGPTAIYPGDSVITGLFTELGVAIPVESEGILEALSVATGTISSYFAFLESISSWLTKQGVPDLQAREYMARVFQGSIHMHSREPQRSFQSFSEEHQTAGGINEQVLNYLRRQGVFDALPGALDAVFQRVRSMAL